MSVWQIAIWIVTSLGVAGTIALFVLYPTIAAAIGRGIIGLFNLVLGYRLGCAILAAIVAGLAVDYWRHDRDDKAYAKQTAAFEQAQSARDARIAAEARQSVQTELAQQTAANTATDTEVKEFTHELPPLPQGDTCRRVGADAPKLHIIAGQVDRRSKGNKGVSKTRRPGLHPFL